MVKFDYEGVVVDNKLKYLQDNYVVVNKKYLPYINVPYVVFTDFLGERYAVRRGVKGKRFSDDEVKEIVRLHNEEGVSYRELSRLYHCSTSTLYKILKADY